MSNLDAILAQAKQQAAEMPAGLPIATGAAAPLPVGHSAGGALGLNMDEDSFLNPGGMDVASYVQVKDAGIRLSKDWTGFLDSFEVLMTPSDTALFYGIRKEVGNNVSYAKTYDGVSTPRGENFATIVEDFKRTSQKPSDIYKGADIPMVLAADYSDPKGKNGAGTLEAGTVVGLSTSITGFKPWATFAKKLKTAGLYDKQLRVKVTHEPRRNAAGQDYGVSTFDVLEVIGEAVAA